MKLRTKKVCAYILITALAGMVSTASASGTGGARTVTKADMTTTGRLLLTPTSSFSNPDLCDATNVAVVLETNPSIKTFQAVALTAFASGSKVKPFFNGCWEAPWGDSIPEIQNMSIE